MSFKYLEILKKGTKEEMVGYECQSKCNMKDFTLRNSNFKAEKTFPNDIITKGMKVYFSTNFSGIQDIGEGTKIYSLNDIIDGIIDMNDRDPIWEKDDPETALIAIKDK